MRGQDELGFDADPFAKAFGQLAGPLPRPSVTEAERRQAVEDLAERVESLGNRLHHQAPASPHDPHPAHQQAQRHARPADTVSALIYIALAHALSPTSLAQVVRAPWTLENQLHWTLDVVFDEDDARTRKDNGPQNLAVIRRLAHDILRAHPLAASIASKMRRANWNKDIFLELFAHMR